MTSVMPKRPQNAGALAPEEHCKKRHGMRTWNEVSSIHFQRFKSLIYLWLILLGFSSVYAQSNPKCDALPHIAVPEQDRPTSDEARIVGAVTPAVAAADREKGLFGARTGCYALGLYYSESPRHFENARLCVLSELGLFSKTDAPAGPSGDIGVDGADALTLAMIYANGEGVTRNLPLARQFVCQDGDEVAIPSNDEMLDTFDNAVKNSGRFDACAVGDFGRRFSYLCLGLQDNQASAQTSNMEKAILASLSPSLKAPFTALRIAQNKFQEAYLILLGLGCEGGTGCGPIMEDHELTVARSWLAALKAIQAGSPPCSGVSASEFVKLDAEINQRYQQMLKDDAGQTAYLSGASIASSDRDADRAWLAYRDAWVRFGQLRWPSVPADQWRAWQTQEWIGLLSGD